MTKKNPKNYRKSSQADRSITDQIPSACLKELLLYPNKDIIYYSEPYKNLLGKSYAFSIFPSFTLYNLRRILFERNKEARFRSSHTLLDSLRVSQIGCNLLYIGA